jgi:hypothetical protein
MKTEFKIQCSLNDDEREEWRNPDGNAEDDDHNYREEEDESEEAQMARRRREEENYQQDIDFDADGDEWVSFNLARF